MKYIDEDYFQMSRLPPIYWLWCYMVIFAVVFVESIILIFEDNYYTI
jgi:hypothetical protein